MLTYHDFSCLSARGDRCCMATQTHIHHTVWRHSFMHTATHQTRCSVWRSEEPHAKLTGQDRLLSSVSRCMSHGTELGCARECGPVSHWDTLGLEKEAERYILSNCIKKTVWTLHHYSMLVDYCYCLLPIKMFNLMIKSVLISILSFFNFSTFPYCF